MYVIFLAQHPSRQVSVCGIHIDMFIVLLTDIAGNVVNPQGEEYDLDFVPSDKSAGRMRHGRDIA